MNPNDFIAKWQAVELKERSASQSHFNDLCALLGIEDPITADPKGEKFAFEKGASKTSGGDGWADVWRKDCFAWEYKGKRANLDKAFEQLLQYAIALENPPLLIVSDMDVIRIHTNWTNTVQQVHTLTLQDLKDATNRDKLRNAFLAPETFKPTKTRQLVTEQAAQNFANLAQRLRERGHDPQQVAHFVNRLVFCMFAEDVELLPNKMFERMIKAARPKPETFAIHAKALFGAMKGGGLVGFEKVDWFNGGLFDNDDVLPLDLQDLDDLIRASALDWSDIDPSILGTLFERGLDPAKRSQLGAHYTDRDKIMQIVNPVIVEPLLAEWAEVKTQIEDLIDKTPKATKDKLLSTSQKAAVTRALDKAEALHQAFLDRLKAFRVLDPACGSGNFLYIALLELKNIEHRVNLEAEALGLPRGFPQIGPEVVLGIELSAYAAELARVSVWIGEIQWMRRNGFEAAKNPILRSLKTIENRDAVLNPDGTRAEWPKADVVVGNPPFISSREMKNELGDDYASQIRSAYRDTVTASSDFVSFWFAQALEAMKGSLKRAGLVATDSLPRGDSRFVLDKLVDETEIYWAIRSTEWYNKEAAITSRKADTAQVRVCIVCFGNGTKKKTLDGIEVSKIASDLSIAHQDGFSRKDIKRLDENIGYANQGIIPRANINEKERKALGLEKASFLLDPDTAAKFAKEPLNPNGKSNHEVIKPFVVGEDILEGRGHRYLVDFTGLNESDASLFQSPFEFLLKVKPHRAAMKQKEALERWWLPWNNRTNMREGIEKYRYIGTPRNAKQRVFSWLAAGMIPDCEVVAITLDDDARMGILSSRFHETWTLATCSFYGVGNTPRYSHKSTFETFPFPEGLTPNIPAADYADDPRAIKIAAAAQRLNELRENWLNPADLVDRVPEVVPGYPDRILPKDDAAAKELKKRTLTNLYNARPAWLDHAHKALDEAVAEAYGWGDDWRAGLLTEDEILARLFKLNQERAAAQDKAQP